MTEPTDNQKKAIEHWKGPALVVAGPGSGKTFVIIKRVEYLVDERNVSPSSILVTTFTRKAANELKVRLSQSLDTQASRIHISTIHSLCKTLLEEHFTEHDMGMGFDVLDEEARRLFLRTNKFRLGIFRRKKGSFCWLKDGDIDDFIRLYDFLTRNNVKTEALEESLATQDLLTKDNERVIKSYKKYLDFLEEEGRVDFANLQLKFYKLINQNESVLGEIQERFKFILVDEYQDVSPLQDKIFRMLAEPQNNLFVVGDRKQSIYGFRGASPLNFQNFTDKFKESKEYDLKVNFRSTKRIVNLSNELVRDKVQKEMAARQRKGERSVLLKGETADSTAERTISLIRKMKNEGIIKKYGDVALLVRSWRHADEYIKYLQQKNIPYIVPGGGGLLDREEITTMVYLISYVIQKLALGKRFRKWKWWDLKSFKTEVLDLTEQTKKALDQPDTDLFVLKNKNQLKDAGITDPQDIEKITNLNLLREEVEESPEDYSLLEIFYRILDHTGYLTRLLREGKAASEEKLQNLARLSEVIRIHEQMPKSKVDDFLWFIYSSADRLDQRKIEDENMVKVMTVHQAKGLEFPVVFLCSLMEGRFPLKFRETDLLIPVPEDLCMNPEEIQKRKSAFYEEERRLFYVGISRAQDNLIFTTSDKIRVQERKRSRFLEEIEEYIYKAEPSEKIEKEYKVVNEIPNLNYSAINTYIDCPFRYKLVYEYGFVSPARFMQDIGSFVHNVLQRIHHEMKSGAPINEEKIEKFADEYWTPVYSKKKKDKKLKADFLQRIKDYYSAAKEFLDEIEAIEEPFIHIDSNMVISGRVDLIARDKDGNLDLIDFKARNAAGIEETNVGKQLKMYHYCLEDDYDIDKLIAYTFMDNKQTEFDPEPKSVTKFLKEMSKRIEEEKYEKKKGAFCKECTFRFCC